jgi:hypothetical protein
VAKPRGAHRGRDQEALTPKDVAGVTRRETFFVESGVAMPHHSAPIMVSMFPPVANGARRSVYAMHKGSVCRVLLEDGRPPCCAGRSALRCSSARVAVAARCWPPSQTGRKSTRRCASGGWPRASARQWCPLTAARARHSLRTASGLAELLLAS